MTIAGLMNKSKYSHNIIRTGDVYANAPYTVLKSELGTTVILPLPTNLNSSMNMDWQNQEVGFLKETIMHNKKLAQELQSATSYKDILKSLEVRGAKAITDSTEDAKMLFARLQQSTSGFGGGKVVKNPRNEMLFNGIQFKSYSFNFVLVPYDKKDSDSIQQAIREIQKASVPSVGFEKMFMMYPETWFVTFMSGRQKGNEYLMKINECCCTGISVNYTPQNDSSNMHDDNAPVSVELTLDFTEVYIPTKENIDEFNG